MSEAKLMDGQFADFERKMQSAGVSAVSIRAFHYNFTRLIAGETGMIPEPEIEAVVELPLFNALPEAGAGATQLLSQTVIIKLNGGLGTSMGLEKAKSLLSVKNGLTFLDIITRQVLHMRQKLGLNLQFMLMDSFSTSSDTLDFLRRYRDIGKPEALELMQSQVPKVDARTMKPVSWPENPSLEWCPPGHGDIYPSLLGSGQLQQLLEAGIRYAFVSNSDNLGATLDLKLLQYFAESGMPFLMEVAERTESDKKGGHLARRNGKFLLRESAQCPEADMPLFQDIQRHRFFNTNNLWLRLDALSELLSANHGFIPLPFIKNAKTVDPRQKSSSPVFQLETAMGAAIECFENSGALVVPRSRFAPVKTTSDLFALRSDAYSVTEDFRVTLTGERNSPPAVALDPEHYKLVEQLDHKLAGGVPSLLHCDTLIVQGAVAFSSGNTFRGRVTIANRSASLRQLPPGNYIDCSVEL